LQVGFRNRETLVPFYELLTAPAAFILDRWFEHEMLKTTLATDAVIGAMCSPYQAGVWAERLLLWLDVLKRHNISDV
jgi:phytoene dehydrogenase-like protein